ncbi:PAS domain-containing protein [Actinomadura fibrosa]|uniref:GAF domain-containing protein n=1 Tax=Actinomadura fibrosa TaxID=111802 RepID=A0ABW2XS27_9ACTN|nr:PAS domain-containing protein [Actinomadura fibrosa]
MASSVDTSAFRRDLDAFSGRLDSLRSSPALDLALAELESAEEELRACTDEIERLAEIGGDEAWRRDVVRAAVRELPVPVFLLDATGVIRLVNRQGAGLLGVTAAYAAGKPFAVFVELPWRVSFRCELADVLREGELGVLPCRLGSRRRRPPQLRLSLIRLGGRPGPGSRPYVLVTVDPTPEPHQEIMAVAAYVRRLDVMGRMTRLLIGARGLASRPLVEAATALLAAECADWAVTDLRRRGAAGAGVLGRAAVAGPEGGGADGGAPAVTRVLRELEPADVSRYIVETGESTLHIPLWESGAFGGTAEDRRILARLATGSAVGVPVRTEDDVLGAMVLIRGEERAPFTVTDLAVFEELGMHLGLALAAAPDADG